MDADGLQYAMLIMQRLLFCAYAATFDSYFVNPSHVACMQDPASEGVHVLLREDTESNLGQSGANTY